MIDARRCAPVSIALGQCHFGAGVAEGLSEGLSKITWLSFAESQRSGPSNEYECTHARLTSSSMNDLEHGLEAKNVNDLPSGGSLGSGTYLSLALRTPLS
jgi:hypothetical protein